MRQLRRIPVISEVLRNNDNKKKLLEYWFTPPEGVQLEFSMPYYKIEDIIAKWRDNEEFIIEFWKNHTDLRLPQVLISSGIMPNYPGFYFYKEDEDSAISSGILKAEDILFWGNNYDENNNQLAETRWVLASEMTKGHLEAILNLYELGKMRVSEHYLTVFKEELKKREE